MLTEENEDDTSSRKVFSLSLSLRLIQWDSHFFLFSFHGNSLTTIFEETETERELLCWNLFVDGMEGGRAGFSPVRSGVLSSYGNEIELETFCFYGCNLDRGC